MSSRTLEIFANRWDCNLSLMAGPPDSHSSYRLDLPYDADETQYNGEVDSLSLDLSGRWGNYVFQLITMFHIAERVGARTLYLRPTQIFPLEDDIRIEGITASSVHRQPGQPHAPRLSGVFFDPKSFGGLLKDLTPDRRVALGRRYVLPLMSKVQPGTAVIEPGDVVLHIRSGDIFQGPDGQGGTQTGGNLYIQPPLCFYEQVVARVAAGTKTRVFIISENALNPTIIPLVEQLDAAGHAVTLRLNQDLPTDLSWLLAGSHVAFANGTIGIAIALLSPNLQHGYFFRHDGTGTLLPVEAYLGDQIVKHFAMDIDHDYPAVGGWWNTPEQRKLMCTFDSGKIMWEGENNTELRNIALGKSASQSSMSIYSRPNESANAISGIKTGDFQFHTDEEDNPWWQVDLGSEFHIEEIRVYNRMNLPERAYSMLVLGKGAQGDWELIHDQGGRHFGGIDGKPARVSVGGKPLTAVRIELPHKGYLHLDQIEVMANQNTS